MSLYNNRLSINTHTHQSCLGWVRWYCGVYIAVFFSLFIGMEHLERLDARRTSFSDTMVCC